MWKSALLAAALSVAALTTSANAAIRCNGGYQVVNGRQVSTPYCQDEELAAQARARGVSVSGAQLRNDPDLKRKVCVAATDTACAAVSND